MSKRFPSGEAPGWGGAGGVPFPFPRAPKEPLGPNGAQLPCQHPALEKAQGPCPASAGEGAWATWPGEGTLGSTRREPCVRGRLDGDSTAPLGDEPAEHPLTSRPARSPERCPGGEPALWDGFGSPSPPTQEGAGGRNSHSSRGRSQLPAGSLRPPLRLQRGNRGTGRQPLAQACAGPSASGPQAHAGRCRCPMPGSAPGAAGGFRP